MLPSWSTQSVMYPCRRAGTSMYRKYMHGRWSRCYSSLSRHCRLYPASACPSEAARKRHQQAKQTNFPTPHHSHCLTLHSHSPVFIPSRSMRCLSTRLAPTILPPRTLLSRTLAAHSAPLALRLVTGLQAVANAPQFQFQHRTRSPVSLTTKPDMPPAHFSSP